MAHQEMDLASTGEQLLLWALERGSDPPTLCIPCASCPYTVDPWVCQDPHCPRRGFCWTGAQAALRGAWECVGCFLLFPSSCWPLSGWEQGVGTGVLGRGCRSPLWLVLGGPPSCSLCLGGAPGKTVLGQGLQQELLGLVEGCSVAVGQGEQGGGRSVLFPDHLGPPFLEGRVQSLIPNSFPWGNWEE